MNKYLKLIVLISVMPVFFCNSQEYGPLVNSYSGVPGKVTEVHVPLTGYIALGGQMTSLYGKEHHNYLLRFSKDQLYNLIISSNLTNGTFKIFDGDEKFEGIKKKGKDKYQIDIYSLTKPKYLRLEFIQGNKSVMFKGAYTILIGR